MFCLFQWKTRKKACIKKCIFREQMALPCPPQTLQERYGREKSLNFHDSKPFVWFGCLSSKVKKPF